MLDLYNVEWGPNSEVQCRFIARKDVIFSKYILAFPQMSGGLSIQQLTCISPSQERTQLGKLYLGEVVYLGHVLRGLR